MTIITFITSFTSVTLKIKTMKIVILDGYTLNPGDLDWSPIKSLGEVTVYERTAAGEVVGRAKGAPIVLTNKVEITRKMMEQLPDLEYIGVMATGFNIIDLPAATDHGITVTNVKGYSTNAVAQHTFALLFALLNRVETHSDLVHAGKWAASKDFTFRETPLLEVVDKTMGLIGLGDIGQKVADIARAFGMRVIAYRKNPQKTNDPDIQMVSLDEVFRQSDVLSLHVPLSAETEHIVNKENLEKMKATAYLLNTARGALINEADLASALDNQVIAGAGLDVLSSEPPLSDNPLLNAKNCVITPHVAWSLQETRERLMHLISENIKAYLHGEPINKVNT